MTDIFGQKLIELSESASPLGAFSKMCLALFPCLTPSLKIWKMKDTPGKRSLFRLVQPTPHTKGKGSGLLPTPTASDATSGQIIGKNDTYKITANNTLRKYSQTGNNSSLSLGRTLIFKIGSGLLPTPTASQATIEQRIRNPSPSDLNGRSLPQRLGMLATPTTSQTHKPIRPLTPSEKAGKHGQSTVGSIGNLYPELIGKKINPQFLEWMMGYPMDWTEINP